MKKTCSLERSKDKATRIKTYYDIVRKRTSRRQGSQRQQTAVKTDSRGKTVGNGDVGKDVGGWGHWGGRMRGT